MSTIHLASVVTSIPGAGICRVQGTGFDCWAIFNGPGSVGLGVRESGSLAAGTQVMVKLGIGAYPGVIMAVLRPPTLYEIKNFKPRTITSPQVSGYYDNGLLRQVLARRTWGCPEFRIDGFMDLVAGEWSKISPFGAYTNVELFRAAMGAGDMASLEFFTDTQAGRLRGLELDVETLSTEDHQHRLWNSLEHTTRDWWTAKEAVTSATSLPRRLAISGPIHQGSQCFMGPPGLKGTPRPALFQESLAADGTKVISSASAIVLQRVVDIDLPEEVAEQDPAAHRTEVAAALTDPRLPIEVTGALNAVTHAQAAWDIIDGMTRYVARNGIDGVPQQWATSRLAVIPAAPPASTSMWGELPRTVEIRLDTEGRTKKFYVGRSTFALLPDGSVLVENSGRAQILLSGPNIVLSAPGDIIAISGGSTQVLAGKHAVVRADGNVQLAANTGRLDLKAERQLSILGGNDGGAEGVLIESRSAATESAAGTGVAGRIGGILLKSASGAFIAAESVGISATSTLTVKAGAGIQIDTGAIAARVVSGLQVYCSGSDVPALQLSISNGGNTLWVNGSTVLAGDVVATGSALIEKQIISGDSIFAKKTVMATSVGEGGTDPVTKKTLAQQISAMIKKVDTSLIPFATAAEPARANLEATLNANVPLLPVKVARLGFSFMDAAEYGAVGFGLPETRWQRAARTGGSKWIEKFVRAPSSTDDTMPYPGRSAWLAGGAYLRTPDQVFFNPETSAFTLSQPSDDPGNTIPAAGPGSLTDFIRSPNG